MGSPAGGSVQSNFKMLASFSIPEKKDYLSELKPFRKLKRNRIRGSLPLVGLCQLLIRL